RPRSTETPWTWTGSGPTSPTTPGGTRQRCGSSMRTSGPWSRRSAANEGVANDVTGPDLRYRVERDLGAGQAAQRGRIQPRQCRQRGRAGRRSLQGAPGRVPGDRAREGTGRRATRSEEHTSELQSRENLVCRLLLE